MSLLNLSKFIQNRYYRCCVSRLLEISKLDGYRAACKGEAN